MTRWTRILAWRMPRSQPSRWWLWLCVLHGMASMLVWWAGEPVAQVLTWRAGESWERPWTWWTTAWVHLHTPHLIGNQLVIGVLVAWAWWMRPDRALAVAWGLAWPISTLLLNGWPQVGYCIGLSGVLHAGLAMMGLFMVMEWGQRAHHPHQRWWGVLLWVGVGLKLLMEQAWSSPVVWDNTANVSVVRAVHLTGALSGVLVGWLAMLVNTLAIHVLRRWRQQSRFGDV